MIASKSGIKSGSFNRREKYTMCYADSIARNNGIKAPGFAPRIGKKGSATSRPSQETIKRKKINRLKDSNPKRALQLFRQAKKRATEMRLKAAQRLIDERGRRRRKQLGVVR